MIGHLPFRTGQVIALDVFDVDVVVFIFQFTLIGRRGSVGAGAFGSLHFVRFRVFGQVIGSHETLAANRASETLFARMSS